MEAKIVPEHDFDVSFINIAGVRNESSTVASTSSIN
jgi:hypothetical protein